MKNRFSLLVVLALLTGVATSVFPQQGTLNVVDSSFAPEVESQNYSNKTVTQVQAFPDGKIVAIGSFNSFNRVPVGKVVRLNADGSLDSTFNTQTVTSLDAGDIRARIILQPDGKIVISCRDIVANGPSFLRGSAHCPDQRSLPRGET